jgi:hypothetical protein
MRTWWSTTRAARTTLRRQERYVVFVAPLCVLIVLVGWVLWYALMGQGDS